MSDSSYLHRISSLLMLLVLLLMFISCSGESDLILIADPYFDEILFDEDHRQDVEDICRENGKQFSVLRYDAQNNSGTFQKELSSSSAQLILLSPLIAQQYNLKRDEVLTASVDNLRDEGALLTTWVTEKDMAQIESLSLSYGDAYIVHDPAEGWAEVDALLSESYEDYHKIGVIYNRSSFGSYHTPEDLLPYLFSDTENRPELIRIDGASVTSAKAKDAVSQLEEKGVTILCLLTGPDTVTVLTEMKGKDMLAVIEHGEYLPSYRQQIYGSISIDYKEICDQLFSASINAEDTIQFIRSTRVFKPY